jgi:hypothetical protein
LLLTSSITSVGLSMAVSIVKCLWMNGLIVQERRTKTGFQILVSSHYYNKGAAEAQTARRTRRCVLGPQIVKCLCGGWVVGEYLCGEVNHGDESANVAYLIPRTWCRRVAKNPELVRMSVWRVMTMSGCTAYGHDSWTTQNTDLLELHSQMLEILDWNIVECKSESSFFHRPKGRERHADGDSGICRYGYG